MEAGVVVPPQQEILRDSNFFEKDPTKSFQLVNGHRVTSVTGSALGGTLSLTLGYNTYK